MSKRLLVTGGSGFVGGHVLSQAAEDWTVTATFNSRPLEYPSVQSVRLDLTDEKSIQDVVEKTQPDVIIHTAAWGDLDACEKDYQQAYHINATATEIIAELSEQLGSRLIYVSTDMVFDGEKGNYKEDDDAHPISAYGKTKLLGERFIQSISSNFVIARAALIYGPPITGSNSFSERIKSHTASGKVMPLFTDQFRTPVLVQNLAQALLELAEHPYQGVLHMGGETRVDRFTFGMRLAELKGIPENLFKATSMDDITLTAPRPRDVSLNTDLAKTTLETKLLGYHEGLTFAI